MLAPVVLGMVLTSTLWILAWFFPPLVDFVWFLDLAPMVLGMALSPPPPVDLCMVLGSYEAFESF